MDACTAGHDFGFHRSFVFYRRFDLVFLKCRLNEGNPKLDVEYPDPGMGWKEECLWNSCKSLSVPV